MRQYNLTNITSQPPAGPNPNHQQPTTTHPPPIGDCGATDTLIREADMHLLSVVVTGGGGLTVGLPNGAVIRSTGTGQLAVHSNKFPSVPAHIFPDNVLDRSLISIADYCNRGCVATSTATDLFITHNGHMAMHGSKEPKEKLWPLLTDFHVGSTINTAHAAIAHQHNAEFVLFCYAALCSPPVTTLVKALQRGYLRTLPRLPAQMVSAYPPVTMATARGHLDLNRQEQRSTQQPTISTTSSAQQIDVNDGDEDNDGDDDNIISRQDDEPVIKVVEISHTNHSDLTGRFPHTSTKGNSYILVSVYNGYVHLEPMVNR